MSTVDLTDTSIAETTALLANIEYYRAMLGAVQVEAARCDYHFETLHRPTAGPQEFPDALRTIIQREILRARSRFLEPLKNPDTLERRLDDEEDSGDGYGMMWMNSVFAALRAQGIWVMPGPNATAQVDAVSGELRAARAQRRLEDTFALMDCLRTPTMEDASNTKPSID
jgi:hypothetical protein